MEDNSFYDELAASAFETDDDETQDEQTADEEETEDHEKPDEEPDDDDNEEPDDDDDEEPDDDDDKEPDDDDETDDEEIEPSDEFYIEEARRKLESFRYAVETEDYIATQEEEYKRDKEEAAGFFESLPNINPITITNYMELAGFAAILENKENWKGTVIVAGEVRGDLWNSVMKLVTQEDGTRRKGVKVRARP